MSIRKAEVIGPKDGAVFKARRYVQLDEETVNAVKNSGGWFFSLGPQAAGGEPGEEAFLAMVPADVSFDDSTEFEGRRDGIEMDNRIEIRRFRYYSFDLELQFRGPRGILRVQAPGGLYGMLPVEKEPDATGTYRLADGLEESLPDIFGRAATEPPAPAQREITTTAKRGLSRDELLGLMRRVAGEAAPVEGVPLQDCVQRLAAFRDGLFPQGVRTAGVVDDAVVGSAAVRAGLVPGPGWRRVRSWESVRAAVRDAGPGAVAMVLALRQGEALGHGFGLYHVAEPDGGPEWVDLQARAGRELPSGPAVAANDAYAVVVDASGRVLPDALPEFQESSSDVHAVLDAPLVHEHGALGLEAEDEHRHIFPPSTPRVKSKRILAEEPGIQAVYGYAFVPGRAGDRPDDVHGTEDDDRELVTDYTVLDRRPRPRPLFTSVGERRQTALEPGGDNGAGLVMPVLSLDEVPQSDHPALWASADRTIAFNPLGVSREFYATQRAVDAANTALRAQGGGVHLSVDPDMAIIMSGEDAGRSPLFLVTPVFHTVSGRSEQTTCRDFAAMVAGGEKVSHAVFRGPDAQATVKAPVNAQDGMEVTGTHHLAASLTEVTRGRSPWAEVSPAWAAAHMAEDHRPMGGSDGPRPRP
ncbi:hypothetical protein SGRIM119S_03417 [Streptomyces griseorubiginosus]